MTLKRTVHFVAIVGLMLVTALFIAFSFGQPLVKAAIQAFSPSNCYTAAATSTQSYMTFGTATTTLACNMGNDGANTAVVTAVLNASSTDTIYNFYVEESMDGQDWFPVSANQSASTTEPFNLNISAYTYYKFASSTVGGAAQGASSNLLGVSGTNNRNHISFNVPVRMERVRVYAALASSTIPDIRNGAVWMQIVPRQSVN